eukprot:545954-Rhodomonas_salina.1
MWFSLNALVQCGVAVCCAFALLRRVAVSFRVRPTTRSRGSGETRGGGTDTLLREHRRSRYNRFIGVILHAEYVASGGAETHALRSAFKQWVSVVF